MEAQQKNKVLVVHSNPGDNPANFRVNFHEPIMFPPHSQVRLLNCRLNLDDNEVLVQEGNNRFQWCLGYGFSDEDAGRGGSCGVFTAEIESGTYINGSGSTDEYITNALEKALNNSVSNMSYLRGGFTVSVAGGKLVVKLSKCSVPTITNGAPTLNKWERVNQQIGVEFTDVGNNIDIETKQHQIQASTNDLTGAGGYNGVNLTLSRDDGQRQQSDYTGFISDDIVSGLSNTDGTNPVALFQLDLNEVEAVSDQREFLEFGLVNLRVSGRGYEGSEEQMLADGFDRKLNLITYDNTGHNVNGSISFTYERDLQHFKIMESPEISAFNYTNYDDSGNAVVEPQVALRTVECATIMNKILQVRIFLLEPTGIPVPLTSAGTTPKYKYRVVVDITDGTALPGGAYDETRDIPENFYRIPNAEYPPRQFSPQVAVQSHSFSLAGTCAFAVANGVVAKRNGFFATCAFDTPLTNYATRSLDVPHQPLFMFGEPLSFTTKNVLETTVAPINDAWFNYRENQQTLGGAMGFDNDVVPQSANANSFTTGLTLPQQVATARTDQACYYLVMEDLPVHNYTSGKNTGKPNKVVGLITLKTKADDLYYPSENKTQLYVDLYNTGVLQYNNLGFRVVDKEMRDVLDINNTTILTLEVRQNPNIQLRDMLRETMEMVRTNVRADYKASEYMIHPNEMGQ